MSCYHPWVKEGDVAKRPLACGKCIGCRLRRASDWAVRCMHEAQMWKENSFILLTYKDAPFSLDHKDFQDFMKRLRFHYRDRKPIRYFMCGEYGKPSKENGFTYRPHFHAIIFNWRPEDAVYFKLSESGHRLYRSVILEKLWPFGHATLGTVTYDSACYVAKYCTKKYSAAGVEDGYADLNVETGEIRYRIPEYGRMSLGTSKDKLGGIGKKWFEKFSSDVFPRSEVVVEGRTRQVPRYYDKLYRKKGYGDAMLLSLRRREMAIAALPESAPGRLEAREKVVKAGLEFFK